MLPYWYQRMYSGDSGTFTRGAAGEQLVYKHHDIFVLGSMTMDTYQPVLNISVMPWSTKNLAPSVWHQLYLQTVRERSAARPYAAAGGGRRWLAPALVFSAAACALTY